MLTYWSYDKPNHYHRRKVPYNGRLAPLTSRDDTGNENPNRHLPNLSIPSSLDSWDIQHRENRIIPVRQKTAIFERSHHKSCSSNSKNIFRPNGYFQVYERLGNQSSTVLYLMDKLRCLTIHI